VGGPFDILAVVLVLNLDDEAASEEGVFLIELNEGVGPSGLGSRRRPCRVDRDFSPDTSCVRILVSKRRDCQCRTASVDI
jgi:hypothetical protein